MSPLRTEEGASAVEYGVMVALIAAIVVSVVIVVGRQSCEGFSAASHDLATGTTVDTPGTDC